MLTRNQLIYWLTIWTSLTLFFSVSLNGLLMSFYFVSFLMPVVVATSAFFNHFLVPRYLLRGDRWRFILYFLYSLIVSVYLELLVMVAAFVILANYQIENLGVIASDIYLLTLVLYLVVLIEGMILTVKKLRDQFGQLSKYEDQLRKVRTEEIAIRVDRKTLLLKLNEVYYIESLGDYVTVHCQRDQHVTKEKISSFENRLPENFVRIHRSFIVNKQFVDSFNREQMIINGTVIPVGRKYRKEAIGKFTKDIIA